MVVGRLNHHAIIYRRMANSRVPTKLGVLSVVPPSVSTKLGLLSLLLLPRHWFSTKYSHGSPFHSHRGFPSPPRDPHTGSSRRSHPFLTVCPHTPAPPSPHHQSLPFCKSQLTSPIHNLMISPSFVQAISVAVKQNKIGISAVANQGFSSGSSRT